MSILCVVVFLGLYGISVPRDAFASTAIILGNTATSSSWVGTSGGTQNQLMCPTGTFIRGVRHFDKGNVGTPSTYGMTVEIDLYCASATVDGTTVTLTPLTPDGTPTVQGFQYPYQSSVLPQSGYCPAGQAVHRLGGWDRDAGGGSWSSAMRIECRPLIVGGNGWVGFDMTASSTVIDVGTRESNATHVLRGPFCPDVASGAVSGVNIRRGGEGYDGFTAFCSTIMQSRFSAALTFTDFSWDQTLGGSGWLVNLLQSGSLISGTGISASGRTPFASLAANTGSFQSAQEVYVAPGSGFQSQISQAPTLITPRAYTLSGTCQSGISLTNNQDGSCLLTVTGRPDIQIAMGTLANFTGTTPQNLVVTATNNGTSPAVPGDGYQFTVNLPPQFVAGTPLPAGCTASSSGTQVVCSLSGTTLNPSSDASVGGQSSSFSIPISPATGATPGTYNISTVVSATNDSSANTYTATSSPVTYSPILKYGTAPSTYGNPSALTNNNLTFGRSVGGGVVTTPIVVVPDQQTSVPIQVTNNTNQPATLAGWIDLNGDGVFESNERVTMTIPANSGTQDYTLVFPSGSPAGTSTYSRFTLQEGQVSNPQPGGTINGDIEDYNVLVSRIMFKKTVSPTAGSAIAPNQVYTYTVTATNVGGVDVPGVSFVDGLADVLDDAAYNNDATSTSGNVSYNNGVLTWTGNLTIGSVATTTYTVTAASSTTGNSIMSNAIESNAPGSNCTSLTNSINTDCYSISPNPNIQAEKEILATTTLSTGSVARYRVTVRNIGIAPASSVAIGDDLTGVLDDASYNNDASSTAGTVTYQPTTNFLKWTGNLAAAGNAGDTATFEYGVTVHGANALGNGILQNALRAPGCPAEPIFATSTPGYVSSCVTQTPVYAWQVAQTTDALSVMYPGDVVTYTMIVKNVGTVPISALTVSSDISGIIDDATYNNDATSTVGTASVTGNNLTWTGDLAPGLNAVITYSFTINSKANRSNDTLVSQLLGNVDCTASDCDSPEVSIQERPSIPPAPTTSQNIGGGGPITLISNSPTLAVVPSQGSSTGGANSGILASNSPTLAATTSSKTLVTQARCPAYTFTRTLRFGSKGQDVQALQRFLNCIGFPLGTSGPGAPGEETIYFVNRTRSSVTRFQEAYPGDILVPLNLKNGTGIFADYSRKKARTLMAQ